MKTKIRKIIFLSLILNSCSSNDSTTISTDDDPNLSIDDAMNQLPDYDGPIGFDPIDIINTMSLPVLWIFGNEDRSHPVRYDVEVLANLSKSNFTVLLYPMQIMT